MKTAVLLSGHPKTYQQCIDSFNLNMNMPHEVFAHIWWENTFKNKCYKMHSREIFDNLDLSQNLIEDFNIKTYDIEKEKIFDISFCKKFNTETWGKQTIEFYRIMTPIILYSLLCQTYSTLQAYLLSERYEIYDVIIKSRPDLLITKPLKSIIDSLNLSNDNIYFQSSVEGGHLYAGEFPNRPCDWFFVSTPTVAKKIFNRMEQFN